LKAKLTRKQEKIEKRKDAQPRISCRKNLPKLVTTNRNIFNIPALVSPAILTPGSINLTPTQLLGGIKWLDLDSHIIGGMMQVLT